MIGTFANRLSMITDELLAQAEGAAEQGSAQAGAVGTEAGTEAAAEGAGAAAEGTEAAAQGTEAAAEGTEQAAAAIEGAIADPINDTSVLTPMVDNVWLPDDVSVTAANVDWLFYGLLGLSLFCFVGITVAVVYFTIKYRARPGHKAEPSASHNDALETTWTIIPAIVCVFLFLFGWRGYVDMRTPPKHALEVYVTAQMWNWNFTYPNGINDTVLHVPVDRSVRLVMKSQDVIHSFFVPGFRIKQDVLPNRYTETWFKATRPGVYRMFCTEYCGKDHSMMKTMVKVHPPGGYEAYLEKKADRPVSAEYGEEIYGIRCVACHTVDGTRRVGPSFKELVMGNERSMADGSKIPVDENYIRESILNPMKDIVEGYPPSMPSFEGQLSDKEILSLIQYIKSLNP